MTAAQKMIDSWFPCTAVDEACRNPAGSGANEKAIFTWFASRPIAQARAAVATALLRDASGLRTVVDAAVRNRDAVDQVAAAIDVQYPDRKPVMLDVFSGRGIIALEAARLGATAVGIDLSPVATLAGRILAEYPLRDWSSEPPLPWIPESDDDATRLLLSDGAPRLAADLELFLSEVGNRVQNAVEPFYPRNPDGSFPWGYLWAISIPCDACKRRFPLLGSLVLRHPYSRTRDPGQSIRLTIDDDSWQVQIVNGPPTQAPTYSATDLGDGRKRKGKSARCPFCQQPHSLETVKAKGRAHEYRDELLAAADTEGETKKVFREVRAEEREAAAKAALLDLEPLGPYSAVPDEQIPAGNVHTVMASGYGYQSFGELMCDRQTLQFVATVTSIRDCYRDVVTSGISPEYAAALASFAAATLARRLRVATRGCGVQPMGKDDGSEQNGVKVRDLFSQESKLRFQFDWFETGPGVGPGTWASVAKTGLRPYKKHIQGVTGSPARFRRGNAMTLPYRDDSVDAIVTDPPYYDMIEYADVSDLMHVWLKRVLFDVQSDLFDPRAIATKDGLQNKNDEIIVRRVHELVPRPATFALARRG